MARKVGNITVYANVFKGDDDERNAPDYRGKINIGDETHELALWINKEIVGVVLNMSGQVTEECD